MPVDKLYRDVLLRSLDWKKPIRCDECGADMVGYFILSDAITEDYWHICPICMDKLESENK